MKKMTIAGHLDKIFKSKYLKPYNAALLVYKPWKPNGLCNFKSSLFLHLNIYVVGQTRQIDRFFIDRKKVITDLFVIEMKEIYIYMYIQDYLQEH